MKLVFFFQFKISDFKFRIKGEWQTRVFYENEEVNASPHKFQVLDANMAVITGLEANSVHQINKKISFNGKF